MPTSRFNPVYVVLLMLLGTVLSLPVLGDEPAPRISVSAEGVADIAPDMAVLTLTVMREAGTARGAMDDSSDAMSQVLLAMTDAGVSDRDLQTSGFSIQPRYIQQPRGKNGERPPAKITGYLVRNTLTVRVRDIQRVGALLDTSVRLGVNQGGDIRFTNADPAAALTRAREAAVAAAVAKASTLASAAGVSLGPVMEISEHSYQSHPRPMARAEMAMDMAASSVPVATGENRYSVTVNMAFAIEQ